MELVLGAVGLFAAGMIYYFFKEAMTGHGDALPPEVAARLKLGRNARCGCGSGKNYKDCHLTADKELQRGLAAHKSAAFGNEPRTGYGIAQRGYRVWTRLTSGEPPDPK